MWRLNLEFRTERAGAGIYFPAQNSQGRPDPRSSLSYNQKEGKNWFPMKDFFFHCFIHSFEIGNVKPFLYELESKWKREKLD